MSTKLTRKRFSERLDSRTLLFITIISCFVTFMATSYLTHSIFTLVLLMLLMLSGYLRACILFAAIYFASLILLLAGSWWGWIFPSPLFLAMIYKVIMPIISAYLLNQVPSGQLTAGLRKLPIPRRVFMILVVMMRFVPTVSHEFSAVQEAMKIRGFSGSALKMICHPLTTLEYAIVPMVFRSLKISDELSSSAIVRGIEYPGQKNSYYVSRFTLTDALTSGSIILAAVLCIYPWAV